MSLSLASSWTKLNLYTDKQNASISNIDADRRSLPFSRTHNLSDETETITAPANKFNLCF